MNATNRSESPADADAAAVRIPPPLLFLIPLALGAAVHYLARPLPITFPDLGPVSGTALRILLGVLPVAGGVALMVGAMRQFKRIGDRPEPWTPTSAIIRGGPYRLTRNPIYVGFTLVTAGIALAFGSVWMLAAVPVGVLLVHYLAVRPEERYLERKFGADYLEYKRAVRRWI